MTLRGRKRQVRNYLREKSTQGATIYEMILAGCGTEGRKNISDLIRLGYNITSKQEGNHKRYFLIEEQPNLVDPYAVMRRQFSVQ